MSWNVTTFGAAITISLLISIILTLCFICITTCKVYCNAGSYIDGENNVDEDFQEQMRDGSV